MIYLEKTRSQNLNKIKIQIQMIFNHLQRNNWKNQLWN